MNTRGDHFLQGVWSSVLQLYRYKQNCLGFCFPSSLTHTPVSGRALWKLPWLLLASQPCSREAHKHSSGIFLLGPTALPASQLIHRGFQSSQNCTHSKGPGPHSHPCSVAGSVTEPAFSREGAGSVQAQVTASPPPTAPTCS